VTAFLIANLAPLMFAALVVLATPPFWLATATQYIEGLRAG